MYYFRKPVVVIAGGVQEGIWPAKHHESTMFIKNLCNFVLEESMTLLRRQI